MNERSNTTTTRIGICLHAYVLDQFDLAGRSLGRSRAKLHSGIHQTRKSIRRIRATLDLGRNVLWPDAAPAFIELRNLCRGLSQVRDAYAVIETVDRLYKQEKDSEVRAALRGVRGKLMKKHAAELDRLLKRDPGLRRYRMRLRSLRDRTEALSWNDIDAADIRSALARSERKAERVARMARSTQHGSIRHRWRRRLRRLRHQMLILDSALNWRFVHDASGGAQEMVSAPEWSAVVRDTVDTLERTADALAFEHDLRILRMVLRNTSGIKENDRDIVLKFLGRKIAHASGRHSGSK